jgi:putative transposase
LGGQRPDEDPKGGVANDLAIRALDIAANLRNPPKDCVFHSDRGSQYAAYDYQKRLQKYEIKPSMSGKGNCYDNAAAETLLASPPFGSSH